MDYKRTYRYNNGVYTSPYDSRDYKFNDLVMGVIDIPDNYETEEMPFIYNQGRSSMCCACAYNSIRFMQERDKEQSELDEPLSPCFTYGNRDSDSFEGEGMYLRDCCKKGRDGSVLLSELPYFCSYIKAKGYVNNNKEDLLNKAKPFAISSFYVCKSRKDIQQAIITTKAVLIGIPVFDCYYRPLPDGAIDYNPSKDVKSNGGHAQAICGWKTIDNKLYWKVLNSWSKDWGVNGYCWLPEDYPWMDDAYVIVDNDMEMTFKDYKAKFYKQGGDTK